MFSAAILLFNQFRTPILIAVVCLAVWGGTAYWGHTKYKAGYEEAHAEHMLERVAWEKERDKWVAQVKQQQQDLAAAVQAKELLAKKAVQELEAERKKVKVIYKEVDREIKANIRVDDVVRFPCIFGRLYNATIDGSGLTEDDKRSCKDSQSGQETTGKTTTINAAYFTGIVINNLRAYNDLALQTNKLIDLVEDLERLHYETGANDIGRHQDPPEAVRGNGPT
jgi:hypothetical protein